MGERSPFDLTGRRALITGSSRGLGFAMATALAGAGAKIVLNARDSLALGAAAADLAETGVDLAALAFDVTSPESVAEAMAHCESEIGPIDILVNNAGTMLGGTLETYATDRFEAILSANVISALNVTQAVIPGMLARGHGKVINICSTRADRPLSGNVPYAASKAALVTLTRGMALEWAPRGLHINGIAPGFFATDMNAARALDSDFQDFVKRVTPMKRWGEPHELGGAVVFLASPASNFVNGHILNVDGAHSIAV